MSSTRPAQDSKHDGTQSEPFGPFTPDGETPLGDTPEAHDEITEHDMPRDHPGRKAVERRTHGQSGTTTGTD